MDEMEVRRDLYQGFGNTLSRAIELVVGPMLFAALGFLADRAVGTGPVLAIAFGALGVAGGCLRAYYAYGEAMKAQSKGKPWSPA